MTQDRPAALQAALRRHLELLRRWNDRVDLVAPADDARWWDVHVEDSLGALDAVPDGPVRILDVGAGAGFPGLVWALARPELQVTLTEPRGKRATFIRTAARQTGAVVEVLSERAEALAPRRWDLVVGRAVAPYARWLPLAAPLVEPEGRVLALLGPTEPEGWGVAEAEAGLVIEREHAYRLPASGADRRVIVLRPVAAGASIDEAAGAVG